MSDCRFGVSPVNYPDRKEGKQMVLSKINIDIEILINTINIFSLL